MENFGKFSYGILVITIGLVVNSYVVYKLWNWLVVPMFGQSEITIGVGFAIGVLISFLKAKNRYKSKEKDAMKVIHKMLGWILMNAGFYLLMGWIATKFL